MISSLFSSLRIKIFLPLLCIFIAIICATLYLAHQSQRALGEKLIAQQVQTAADFYLDNINIMMINDEMESRAIVQEKMLAQPGMVEARIIRAPIINEEYDEGFDDQYPVDDLDEQGLLGNESLSIRIDGDQNLMTVVRPIPNLEVYRGTKCLGCHEEAPEGTILGAVRISYDMDTLYNEVNDNLFTNAIVQLCVFAIGILILVQIITLVVNRPMNRLSDKIKQIEANSDLTGRIEIHSKDEIGVVSGSLNSMLQHFQSSLSEVAASTQSLFKTTEKIAAISEITKDAASRQNSGTELVATAIDEMDASCHQVRENAAKTSDVSIEANQQATKAVDMSTSVIKQITEMSEEVASVGVVIENLNEKTNAVTSVLVEIKGIAEQTNLLALNAAIEAARAGDAGRGFAVVADEVRTLSKRTHESTNEIEKTIANLQKESAGAVQAIASAKAQADSSVGQVNSTVESLREIAKRVDDINGYNTQMASASEEQSLVADDISKNVSSIRDISDETLGSAQEVTEASEDLLQLSRQLEASVNSFKV